jgi:bacillithiol biosynthesis cysteine-adding enzyme BshC
VKTIELALEQKNTLASDYITGNEDVSHFFDYSFQAQTEFEKRYEEIKNRSFPREKLVKHLLAYNKIFSPGQSVIENINKLNDPGSVVVIGGQQAGVLTGPLFSIYKCLSIILLAKKQEERLGVPVIPLFWIAGEDHDFAEINHTYVFSAGKPEKRTVRQSSSSKQSVSDIKIDKKEMGVWLDKVVKSYGETKHTKEILRLLHAGLRDSETYVDFFSRLIMTLFKKEGLVLLDSGDPELREIESPFLTEMIVENEPIYDSARKGLLLLHEKGYQQPLMMEDDNANLFYHFDGERILLERDEEGWFRGKNNECMLSREELLDIASRQPQSLSNNVVTRPLMQELLFPTLAFIAGPGEIAYWASLKDVFHHFDRKMPPLVPRLNVTLIDDKTNQWLKDRNFLLQTVLTKGVSEEKERWFQTQKSSDVESTVRRTKQDIGHVHEAMRTMAEKIDSNLAPIAEKNLEHIYTQIDYLSEQMDRSLRIKYGKQLKKYDDVDALLHPHNQPQERMWNVFPFINGFGFELIEHLLKGEFECNGKHKVVFLPYQNSYRVSREDKSTPETRLSR